MKQDLHIALLGNPNSGKSSLFNSLTGLNQKVGNFPGVTVEKKTGACQISSGLSATIIDLPGSYSLYPRRADEWVSYRAVMEPEHPIDIIVVIVDASNLQRNLLYASQVADLQRPVILALTMMDVLEKKGTTIDIEDFSKKLGLPVVAINPRKNQGIKELKRVIEKIAQQEDPHELFIELGELSKDPVKEVQQLLPTISPYCAVHYLINHEDLQLEDSLQEKIENIEHKYNYNHTKVQADEILRRYTRIRQLINETVHENLRPTKGFTAKLDAFLLHRIWGYAIMFVVLFFLFQSVFLIAEYPMTAIEYVFGELGSWLSSILKESWFSNLLINGFLAGLSGILVFVPQIMILFGIITFLEDTGYMARISFLSDRVMRKVGLNGKSVMPMISGFACAVPAIMSARNIENRKERLLTIMITPLMSCSARLPVFTILIALVIPSDKVFGFFSLQGLVMMGLYVLGLIVALLVAYIMKFFIKLEEKSFFILELPIYRSPRWKNIFITMFQKAKIFIFDAGKVIMVISVLLWALSSYGPSNKRDTIQEVYTQATQLHPEKEIELKAERDANLLENSYAGIAGRTIEPILKPLGYDWKIGIALITSFAAREVFVGTMATLYSVGDQDDDSNQTLRDKLNAAIRPDGSKVYTLATGVSLMIFYVFAMQCMSTLAIVKKETGTWKWPIIQLLYMTALAYVLSWVAFIALS
ncbi:MAG: ferrous iron transport protein B [Sphingobacteriales bacterium]